MADLEIYVNGVAVKQVQGANTIVDAMSATIMKQHNPGLSDKELRQLIAAHLDEDEFCRYVIPVSYTHLLLCGALNPEETLPKFNQELKDAGLDVIIQEKQAQLDAWLAAQS